MSRLLGFEKLRNTRDLGGMRTSDGRVIAPGRLIRSGALAGLTEQDRAALGALVRTVIDLRSDSECAEKPDSDIPGAEYVRLPIIDDLSAGVTRDKSSDEEAFAMLVNDPGGSRDYLRRLYRTFVVSDGPLSRYSRFVRMLLEPGKRAVLWHCTAGKDRAGIAAAIVEELLGVAREDIVADYLMTNVYLEEDVRELVTMLKRQLGADSEEAETAMRHMFGAEREYIGSFYDAVEERFGGFRGFAREGLRLSDGDIAALKDIYLTDRREEHADQSL